jgi:hypothetical protein
MPRQKKATIEVTYQFHDDLERVFKTILFHNKQSTKGDWTINKDSAKAEVSIRYNLPFQEPRVEEIDGKFFVVYKSNFDTHD